LKNAMLQLAISPCPNDTFAFDAWIHKKVRCDAPDLDPILLDIEELNRRATGPSPRPGICKMSIPAFAEAMEDYVALRAGGALGFGVGPIVVVRDRQGEERRADGFAQLTGKRIAVPGQKTTAALLLRHFLPSFEAVEMRFDRVFAAVEAGVVEAGVVIHEGRFTFADHGLAQVSDLGRRWEERYALPLPLAVIGLRRDLVEPWGSAFERALADSVRFARNDPQSSASFVQKHAQEMAASVCQRHIDLYVNEETQWLSGLGKQAIVQMLALGENEGLWHLESGWRRRVFLAEG
jgi:1,4-dihydroxy-6-naphthoate synthase